MKNFTCLLLLLLTNLAYAQQDQLTTNEGPITLTPILHATMVLEWAGKTIYLDPYDSHERFTGFADPDLVLITHAHGDHLNKKTLAGLNLEKTQLIAPQSVVEQLDEIKFAKINTMKNGEILEVLGLKVAAIPMYNLPESPESRHQKGWGNAYVLEIGGKRLYISGDTEDITEMRNLIDIDYAFVCMNLPYTMDVKTAADAVLDFAPKVVYPFHYRGKGDVLGDVALFKKIVLEGNKGIEVRLRNWYP